MERNARTACLLALLAAACHQSGAPASSSGTLAVTTAHAGQSSGPGGSSGGGSTSSVPEDSTSAASTGTTTGDTTLSLDVGTPDLGVPGPAGCRGKIDFLFVISRLGNMAPIQDKLHAAFPEFVATIESRFADFDYHIMVVDGDEHWGNYYCNMYDCDHPYCVDPDYPCEAIDTISKCDATLGAGTLFNAGRLATDAPCELAGGKRYIVTGQPDLPGAFDCIARVGLDGGARLGEALAAAVDPWKTGDCNAGFLRDDALLFVSLITWNTDLSYYDTPDVWAQAVLDAKHGDPNAVVMFTIHPLSGAWWPDIESCADDPQGTLCRLTQSFPYSLLVDVETADYGASFEQAADLVGEACSAFIPG